MFAGKKFESWYGPRSGARLMCGAVGLAVVVSLAACGASEPSEAGDSPDKVIVGGTVGALSSAVAERLSQNPDLQAKYNLDVEFQGYANSQELYAGIASGRSHTATASPTTFAQLASQGAPVHISATLSDSYAMLLGKTAITGPDDLRGKSVAITGSGLWDLFAAQIEASYGLVPDEDYKTINTVDLLNGVTMLLSGNVEYAFGWESGISTALNKYPEIEVALSQSDVDKSGADIGYLQVVGVHESLPVEVEARLIPALGEVAEQMQTDIQSSIREYSEAHNIEADPIIESMNEGRYAFIVRPLNETDIEAMGQQIEFAGEAISDDLFTIVETEKANG